jgi:hypothetical protein
MEIVQYMLIIITVALIAVAIVYLSSQPYTPRYYNGIVEDFDISAGGFGTPTKCTIETNETKVVASGSVCNRLKRGIHLYEQGGHYEVEEKVNGQA